MLGLPPKKNRNLKGLALGAEAAKPGTLSGTTAQQALASTPPALPPRQQPQQVSGSSRAQRHSAVGSSASETASPLLPTTPSLSSSGASSRSSYHNKLSEQLATLEIGVEFKLDLRSEDLEVMHELGCGNGGTVSKCLHVPTKAIMAKKVSFFTRGRKN